MQGSLYNDGYRKLQLADSREYRQETPRETGEL